MGLYRTFLLALALFVTLQGYLPLGPNRRTPARWVDHHSRHLEIWGSWYIKHTCCRGHLGLLPLGICIRPTLPHFGQHLVSLLYIKRPHIIPEPLDWRLGYDQLAQLLCQEQLRTHRFALVQHLLQVFPRPTERPDQPIAVLAQPAQLGSQSPGAGLVLLHLLLQPSDPARVLLPLPRGHTHA